MLPEAKAYESLRGLELTGALGDGVDGNVWSVRSKGKRIPWAMKMQRRTDDYERERDCYARLAEHGINKIAGFNIPVCRRTDDVWKVIEMSIVTPPFIVDFAGAYLDECPNFSEEVWQERFSTWEENYGEQWPPVHTALCALKRIGIHYLDVHHHNISMVGWNEPI